MGPRVLRFEARWLKEVQFREIVEEAWQASGTHVQMNDLAGRLSHVHKALHHWDRTVLKNSSKKLKRVQKELDAVAREALTPENVTRQKELADEVEWLLEQEEIYHAQRSRIDWLNFGDKNTSYF